MPKNALFLLKII